MRFTNILLVRTKAKFRPFVVCLCSLFFSTSTSTFANPILDNVSAGQVNIQQAPNSTIINQSSPKAIINWESFNIGAQETTHFQQPAGGVALNRINPSQGVSQIYGRLTATGQIILVNPAGIFFGPGSYVNVGGMMATTLNITDQDFLNNYYHFSSVNGYNGSIINQGTLIAANHGLIALVGGAVRNDGMISANLGHIVLASGDAATVTFAGNDLIGFSIDGGVTKNSVDQDGRIMRDGVSNNGALYANGGHILISAKDAAGVLDHVINMKGIAQAQSISDGAKKHDGEIYIHGESNNAIVRLAGLFDASSINDIKGGTIIAKADHLIVENGTRFDVSSQYGNGGFIDTSGMKTINIGHTLINAAAPHGINGSWLIDPTNIFIALNQTNATAAGMIGTDTSANTGPTPYQASGAIQDSLVLVSTLTAALASANVTVTTNNTSGTGFGDITVVDGISWNSANSLTLSAYRNITLNNTLSSTGGGGLNLVANNSAAFLVGSSHGTVINNSVLTISGPVNIYYNPPVSYSAPVTYTNTGGAVRAHMLINNVTELQNMNTNLAGIYALNTNIDATITNTWNAGSGFLSVGTPATQFTGSLYGQNYSISNLYMSQPNATISHMGLFGQTSGSTFSDINLVNAYVRLNFDTFAGGILAGRTLAGTTISNSTTSGTITFGVSGSPVSGYARMGGMVGENQGTVTNSYSTANVSAYQGSNTFINVGGFTGNNIGTISTSYSAGNVFYSGGSFNSSRQVGGFNGAMFGTINNSYSISSVTIAGSASSNLFVGGFAGQNNAGSLSNSYSSGLVTNTLGGFTGGFTGQNASTFANNIYDTQTSGMGATAVGTGSAANVTGRTTNEMMTLSTFTTPGWSITNIPSTTSIAPGNTWFIFAPNSGVGYTRPMLMMERKSTITQAHQLQMMGSTLGGTYTLANNIDLTAALNSTYSTSDVWGTRSSTPTGTGFAPIGGTGNFTGSFNGQNYTISNLYINRSASSNIGLFAQMSGSASISNLALTGVNIRGASSVGGLVGAKNSGTVTSVSVAGNMTGSGDYIGGLTGYNVGTISGHSYVLGNVTATGTGSNIGGFVGQNWGNITAAVVGDIYYGGGTVHASGAGGSLVGGLIGWNRGGVLTNVFTANSATVTALSHAYVGGLIGQNDASVVSSYSAATVNGGTYVTGGLIGFNYGSISGNTYATGNVTATQFVGGLIGAHQGAAITPATQGLIYATGNVTGTWEVGGLIGENYAALSNVSYTNHSGGVTAWGAEYVGGLVGLSFGSSIHNSYADTTGAAVTGASQVGGLVGGNASTITGNSYAIGNVIATGSNIGGLIGINYAAITGTTPQPIYANGTVSGATNVGGLVGNNNAGITITNAAVNSTISGNTNVGGLVGYNAGTVTGSAPGSTTVSGSVTGGSNLGAFVGLAAIGSSLSNASIGTLTLQGLSGYNHYALTTNNITGVLNIIGPGSENNTLDLSGFSDPGMTVTLSGNNTGSITFSGQAGTLSFSTMQNLISGSGNDTVRLQGGSLTGNIDAGAGNNTLIGDNVSNTWIINAMNGGTVTGLSGSFSNFQNLTGGTALDTFNFMPGFHITGLVDGGDVVYRNNIRFNTHVDRLNLFLDIPTTGDVFNAGTVYTTSNTLLSTFTRIQQSDGNNLGYLYLPNKNRITVSFYDATFKNGEIGDPFYFNNWIIANPPTPQSNTNAPSVVNPYIAPIVNQPQTNATNNNFYNPTSPGTYYNIDSTIVNKTYTDPLLNTTSVIQTGNYCFQSTN